jgi:Cu/Ag efflux pump CusA
VTALDAALFIPLAVAVLVALVSGAAVALKWRPR